MPALPLEAIPGRSDVFVDANIFIYGLSGYSLECRRFLDRCYREELYGITLLETVNEATHRWMVAEAYAKGLISARTARALREQPAVVALLSDYWRDTERLLALNLLFLPVSVAILQKAYQERKRAGLLTNDSMIIGCMREFGITSLASSDRDFERATGITLFRPGDLP